MASTSSYRLRGSTYADTSVQWKFDVFLSFRGEDTRQKFTAHLYDKLVSRGIRTFRDDPDLERGKAISPELLAAIEHSRFAVVVFSPNYASSKWCLMELVKIVQCMGERGTIVPVFYEVDPSDVRHQKGSFAAAFAEHEKKFGKPSEEDLRKLQEWRDTLTKVANLSGWTSKDSGRDESDFIKAIVDALLEKMHPTIVSTEKLFGIDSRLMELHGLLRTKTSDTCFIGIWGLGGIGKTTLAEQVYHKISHDFELSIFLRDFRQLSAKHQQEQLLCQIPNEKNTQVQTVDDGVAKIKRCLCSKKIILVLDDVDQLDQLKNLAGGKDWFGSGSVIIITTRNQHLLVSHDVEIQYKSKGLNVVDALQYFSWKAFKKYKPEEGYMQLCTSIVDYAGGLPLALKTLGSFLWKRDRDDWESTVTTLKKAPIDHDIFKVLKISYDGLDERCQQVLLDIVCFLKGYDKERVIQILNSVFDFDTRIKINILVERSLLTTYDNCVDMHDLIQEMGREIVRLECKEKPGKRSRLWLRDDVFRVLKQNVGTETIKSIALCLPESEELAWNPNAFSKMSELKFLKMENLVLCHGPESLPDAIRVLKWTSYPAKSLPPNFQPVELFELTLHHSKLNQLWHKRKYLEKLTTIDLSYSKNLTKSPDFSGTPNLEWLIFEGCTNLVDIHPSITSLKRLKVLNFKNCKSIKNLPGELEMDSLEMIDLSGCSKVKIFPRFVSRMDKLSELSFGGIGMQTSEISYIWWNWRTPKSKVLSHRLSLVLASLKHFCSLNRLNLNDCKLGEGEIPDDIGCLSSLEDLDLSANNFVSLPASISRLSKLKCLRLADCKRLEQLPCLPLISCTCHVTADNCVSLKKLLDPPEVCRLWNLSLNFINCRSIEDGGTEYGVDEGTSYIYSMLQRFLQEPPPFFEMFSIVIPGNVIPWWFKTWSVEASGTQWTPDWDSCPSEWIGFALCVLFGPEENHGVLGQDHDLEPHTISCSWKPGAILPVSAYLDLSHDVESDHLCLFLLPSKHFYYDEPTDFDFQTMCATKSKNACLKVKGCGVRALYKQDVENIDFRMSQHNMSERNFIRWFDPPSEVFSFVLSGNEISEWFEERTDQDSVVVGPPRRISISSTSWIGVAVCVLFEADENKGDLCEVSEPEPHVNKISCCWDHTWTSDTWPSGICRGNVEQVVQSSDHLSVFFVPRKKFAHSELKWKKFHFNTRCGQCNGNLCLKVKGCGIRRLYEVDLKPPYSLREIGLHIRIGLHILSNN